MNRYPIEDNYTEDEKDFLDLADEKYEEMRDDENEILEALMEDEK